MTRTTNARLAGFTFLAYIVTESPAWSSLDRQPPEPKPLPSSQASPNTGPPCALALCSRFAI